MGLEQDRVRRDVAKAIERLLVGEIEFAVYAELVPEDTDDDLVAEALDLVEHMPKPNRFWGARNSAYELHMARLRQVVARMIGREPEPAETT